jgi:aldose 1-epimerase
MKTNHPNQNISKWLTVAWSACMLAVTTQAAPVTSKPFGKTTDGRPVELYTLANSKGVSVSISTYGAAIVDLVSPDRKGKSADIALGFDNVKPYLTGKVPYFGATIGRYANRIAKGQFVLDGKTYQLATNDGPNALHGGVKGFDKRVWKAEILPSKIPSVRFSLHSADGDEGYPGALEATVTYSLSDKNDLRMDYGATTDKKTVVNLTNHTYYNLKGAGNGTVLNHEVMIPADFYTPVGPTLIPTGELKKVEGTVMDFRTPTTIGARIKEVGGKPVGYDHNYVLHKGLLPGVKLNAEVYEPVSGRVLQVYSDQPGVQFYTGNFLDGTLVGKGEKAYQQYSAFCLEPQHFPDSPNQPKFPSVVLNPGQTYHATIVAHFSTK